MTSSLDQQEDRSTEFQDVTAAKQLSKGNVISQESNWTLFRVPEVVAAGLSFI